VSSGDDEVRHKDLIRF
jgi:transcription elongation factor SPT5